jgi:SAM-dependent methyltransferase
VADVAVVRAGSLVRNVVPPVLFRTAKRASESLLAWRYPQRPVPWTRGYRAHRNRVCAAAIRDADLLDRFRLGEPLPDGYGAGLDERCVEYPWCLSHLPDGADVLDAGSVLNQGFLLDHHALTSAKLHILTLAPEHEAHWRRGISYLYGDLRDIPIRDGTYDVVVCLSTLEHVAMDNTPYTGRVTEADDGRGDFTVAMRELHRVLRPGGTLLFSVPYGVHEDRGVIQQFDGPLLKRAIEAFPDPQIATTTFFRHLDRGWQVATQNECGDACFGVWGAPEQGRLEGALPAAEAVACVELRR